MEQEVDGMRIVNIIITIILMVSIPVSIICLANNLTGSMPDLYQYELKSTDILTDSPIGKSEDEVAQIFADFMTGYLIFYKHNLKLRLRRTFARAAIIFGILTGGILIGAFVSPLMNLQYNYLFDYEIKSFMVLPSLSQKLSLYIRCWQQF